MASAAGTAPPDSDVPAPRGTMFTPSRCAKRSTASDLRGVMRQHHGERPLAVCRQCVGFVGAHQQVVIDDIRRPENGAQTLENRGLAGNNGRVRLR